MHCNPGNAFLVIGLGGLFNVIKLKLLIFFQDIEEFLEVWVTS